MTRDMEWSELQPFAKYANRLVCRPSEAFGPRIITDHQFIYVERGFGDALILGNFYPAEPGTLFYYGPGEPHRFEANEADPFVIYGLHWRPRAITSNLWDEANCRIEIVPVRDLHRRHPVSEQNDRLPGIPVCSKPGSWVKPLFDEAVREYRRMDLASHVLLSGIVYQLLGRLYRWMDKPSSERATHLEQVTYISEMLEHLAEEPYQADWLESWTLYGRDYISRLFKRVYGISPHEYHLRQKLDRAQTLLRETDLTISEIAHQLHFSSIHYFSRLFKTRVGEPPKAYREQNRWL